MKIRRPYSFLLQPVLLAALLFGVVGCFVGPVDAWAGRFQAWLTRRGWAEKKNALAQAHFEDWPRWRGPRGDGSWHGPAIDPKDKTRAHRRHANHVSRSCTIDRESDYAKSGHHRSTAILEWHST